jgi:hypothetical protein
VPFIPCVKINAFETARAGMAAATQKLGQAAADVALSSLAANPPPASRDSVSISAAAQSAAAAGDSGPSLEHALIDSRMAKYEFVANLRVAETAQQMTEELTSLVGRK